MAATQSPIGTSASRPAEHGLGRPGAWCCDHRRRVLASWLLARLRLKQPDLVVNLIATQIPRSGDGSLRRQHRTAGVAVHGSAADALAPARQLLLSVTASTCKPR